VLFGRGQVGLSDTVRISLGRAWRDKARFWFGVPYALGFGLFASLSTGDWAYGMTSAGTYTVLLHLMSSLFYLLP